MADIQDDFKRALHTLSLRSMPKRNDSPINRIKAIILYWLLVSRGYTCKEIRVITKKNISVVNCARTRYVFHALLNEHTQPVMTAFEENRVAKYNEIIAAHDNMRKT